MKKEPDGIYSKWLDRTKCVFYLMLDGQKAGYWDSREQAERVYISKLEESKKFGGFLRGKTYEQQHRIVFGK